MNPRIETERLILRMPCLDDAEGAAELVTDPEVMRFLGGNTVPRTDVAAVIEKWLARWEASGFGQFAIERRADGRFLGRVGMILWDTRDWTHSTFAKAGEHGQPELGWALARAHWGQGYMLEAALAARAWAREQGIGRLISCIHHDNLRSQRLAARLDAQPGEIVELSDTGPHVAWLHPA